MGFFSNNDHAYPQTVTDPLIPALLILVKNFNQSCSWFAKVKRMDKLKDVNLNSQCNKEIDNLEMTILYMYQLNLFIYSVTYMSANNYIRTMEPSIITYSVLTFVTFTLSLC